MKELLTIKITGANGCIDVALDPMEKKLTLLNLQMGEEAQLEISTDSKTTFFKIELFNKLAQHFISSSEHYLWDEDIENVWMHWMQADSHIYKEG